MWVSWCVISVPCREIKYKGIHKFTKGNDITWFHESRLLWQCLCRNHSMDLRVRRFCSTIFCAFLLIFSEYQEFRFDTKQILSMFIFHRCKEVKHEIIVICHVNYCYVMEKPEHVKKWKINLVKSFEYLKMFS